MYRVLEIELVGLHWAFVAAGDLHGERRSLACFLVNLVEVAVFSSIALVLLGCAPSMNAGRVLYDNLAAVFSLSLVATAGGQLCRVIAHAQLVVAVTLISVIVANLVGTVAPKTQV